MIRKLFLPLAALVLLAGCASTGYSYRAGSGDYYHGRAQVEYRYYPSYYPGYPYGYHGPYRYSNPYGYRYSNPYGSRYYGYPYGYGRHGYPYYPRRHVRPGVDPTPDRPRSHWRDLDRLRDRGNDRGDTRGVRANPTVTAPRTPDRSVAPTRVRTDSAPVRRTLRPTRERRHEIALP